VGPRNCPRIVQVERGLSRHEVVFVSYAPAIYALKEMPLGAAEREYDLLSELEKRGLPAVIPVGRARTRTTAGEELSVLVTRFLDNSLPYRTLFPCGGARGVPRVVARRRRRIAGAAPPRRFLLGRLFALEHAVPARCRRAARLRRGRRDLGLQRSPSPTPQRRQDVLIMQENLAGELADLAAAVAPSRSASRPGAR
jgi:hypothetical protein